MGSKNTSQKKTDCCLCLKRKVKPDNTYKGMAIKEVYILFLIFDFFPLNDLTRASQISRGLYWLTGNPLILAKFQISSKEIKIEQFELHPLTPK